RMRRQRRSWQRSWPPLCCYGCSQCGYSSDLLGVASPWKMPPLDEPCVQTGKESVRIRQGSTSPSVVGATCARRAPRLRGSPPSSGGSLGDLAELGCEWVECPG